MGIRKHFENQEPKDQDMKISDFSLDTQESNDLIFDPEQEISPEMWQEMKNLMESQREAENWYFFVLDASYLITIFPDRAKELNLDDETFNKCIDYIRQIKTNASIQGSRHHPSQNLSFGAELKILFPRHSAEIEKEFPFDQLNEQIHKYHNNPAWKDFAFGQLAACTRILYPNRYEEFDFDPVKAQRDLLQELDDISQGKYPDKNFASYFRLLKYFKILFPDQRIQPSEKMLQDLLKDTEDNNGTEERKLKRYIDHAAILQFIQADRVMVTDQGLKLIMPKPDLKTKKTKRPTRKTF